MAARAVFATLTRERERTFVRAGVAADAREAELRHTAREEAVGDSGHHRAPLAVLARELVVVDRLHAVQLVRDQPKEW